MNLDICKINFVVNTEIPRHQYNDCCLNDIEFNEDTKKFIEDFIKEFQNGIAKKEFNLFENSNENDKFLRKILEKFPDRNNELYSDINSCIGNIDCIVDLINDIFKFKVCKNISVD